MNEQDMKRRGIEAMRKYHEANAYLSALPMPEGLPLYKDCLRDMAAALREAAKVVDEYREGLA